MKTPFYIVKRVPVNKEMALEKWRKLLNGDNGLRSDTEDLIDFCLSGGIEEKVFIDPGMRVRIKGMPEGAFDYNIPGVGAECEITDVCFYQGGVSLSLNTVDDYNCLRIKGDNLDLSEYLELV